MTNHHLQVIDNTVEPLWVQLKELFTQHNFLTIICGFFVIVMVISFYRFLRSISPALVTIVLVLTLFILVLHWTQTGTEPSFLKPFIDWLSPYLPTPTYSN